jgi:hypothetical protein
MKGPKTCTGRQEKQAHFPFKRRFSIKAFVSKEKTNAVHMYTILNGKGLTSSPPIGSYGLSEVKKTFKFKCFSIFKAPIH